LKMQSIIDVSNFYKYTLTPHEFKVAAGINLVVLLAICIYGKRNFKDERKLAWVMSAFSSGFMTVMGVIYLYVKHADFVRLIHFQQGGWSIYHGVSNVGALICLWFGMANVIDLLFGLLFYRKQLGLITAYIHHTVFIWMMVAASTGNGGFLTVHQFTPAFCSMLIEELPTFLLALGSINSSFRTDLGFGLTFFLLRIVYHGYFFVYAYYSKCDSVVIALFTLTMAMHVNWFYAWVTKYGMKFLGGGKKAKKIA